jgi:hypothetical protein
MSNYSKTTDFAAKDSLPSGDSGKIIRGSEFETEFDNISTAIATKADTASPTFTGTVTIPTLSVTGNTTLGNAATDTVTVTADIASNLIPSADDTYNLGASGAEWNDLYVDGVAYIDTIDGAATSGDFTFTGASYNAVWDSSDNALEFADNARLKFGDGNDLLIYHDGSESIIRDNGAGNLNLRGNSVSIANSDASKSFIEMNNGSGAVSLYYANAEKFQTTSTGVDVTGTMTADGLTVDGSGTINGSLSLSSTNVNIDLMESDATDLNTRVRQSGGDFFVQTLNDAKSAATNRLAVDHSTGDISFYEDTGTTAKFFWDASLERLGVGNSSPATALDVTGTVTADGLTVNGNATISGDSNGLRLTETDTTDLNSYITNQAGALRFRSANDAYNSFTTRLQVDHDTGDIRFFENTGTTAKFYWDASAESLGINTNSPATELDVNGDITANNLDVAFKVLIGGTTPRIELMESDSTDLNTRIRNTSGVFQIQTTTDDLATNKLRVAIDNSDGEFALYNTGGSIKRLVWDAVNLRLAVGASSANRTLDVAGDAEMTDLYLSGGAYLGGTAEANKLDDYEEGTWTPTAQLYDGTMTVNSATYTKIGNLVILRCSVSFDSTTDSSGVGIQNIPFAHTGTDKGNGGFITKTTVTTAVRMVAAGTGTIQVVQSNDANIDYTSFASSTLGFTFMYETTS